jgi:hypothetical protein
VGWGWSGAGRDGGCRRVDRAEAGTEDAGGAETGGRLIARLRVAAPRLRPVWA